MGLDVSLRDISFQLQQLDQRPAVNPDDAMRALEDLEGISDRILQIIDKVNTPMMPRDIIFVDTMAHVVAKLQERFFKNTPIGRICNKMKRVSRKEKVSASSDKPNR